MQEKCQRWAVEYVITLLQATSWQYCDIWALFTLMILHFTLSVVLKAVLQLSFISKACIPHPPKVSSRKYNWRFTRNRARWAARWTRRDAFWIRKLWWWTFYLPWQYFRWTERLSAKLHTRYPNQLLMASLMIFLLWLAGKWSTFMKKNSSCSQETLEHVHISVTYYL